MNFTQFNKNQFKKIDWQIETKEYCFKKLSEYGNNAIINVKGFFFMKTNFGLQLIAIDEQNKTLVNLPCNKQETISNLLKDDNAINAIKNGECFIQVRSYHSKKYNKECFTFDFVESQKVNY